jgi:hypothetical protein
MATARETAEFGQLLNDFNKAYETGSDWFSYFDPHATIYAIGSTEPFVGLAAYEANFQSLLKEKRVVEDLRRDIHVIGDTAVTMQLQQVTQSNVVTIFRQSLIWMWKDNGWKIVHMHSALATNPRLAESVKEPQAIKLLTDKIATVSAQVGVAQ